MFHANICHNNYRRKKSNIVDIDRLDAVSSNIDTCCVQIDTKQKLT